MDSGLFVWKVKLSLLAAAAVLGGLHAHDATHHEVGHGRGLASDARLAACVGTVSHSRASCSTGLRKPPLPVAQHDGPGLPLEVSASAQVDD